MGHTHKDNKKEIEKFRKIGQEIIIKMKNEISPTFKGLEYLHTPQRKRDKKKIGPHHTVYIETLKEKTRIHQGIADVFGQTFEQLELHRAIGSGYKQGEFKEILKEIVLSRLSDPCSKRKSVKIIERNRGKQFDLNKVYRLMDKLYKKEDEIKTRVFHKTLSLLKERIHIAFFDVTTLYFESFEPDTLRICGYSKDNKVKETQVVLALMTSVEGLPIGYELFPGNTCEGKTLIKVVEKFEQIYDIAEVSIIADRAMFTRENLQVLNKKKTKFIVASKLKTMSRVMKEQILKEVQDHCVQKVKSSFIKSYVYEGQRLIVSYNSHRANRDKKSRLEIIEKLQKQMDEGKIPLSRLIRNTGSRKYLTIDKKSRQEASLDSEKIKEAERWDGIHGVITNHTEDVFTEREIFERYKGLWQIETAFRVNKHDLKMRPIYHWTPKRVKGHILICYLAYSILSFIKFQLSQKHINLSFERLRDELKEVQYSVVSDETTGKAFILPSRVTSLQKHIYEALNIKFTQARFIGSCKF